MKLYNDLQLSDFSYGHVRIRLNLRVLDIVNISSIIYGISHGIDVREGD